MLTNAEFWLKFDKEEEQKQLEKQKQIEKEKEEERQKVQLELEKKKEEEVRKRKEATEAFYAKMNVLQSNELKFEAKPKKTKKNNDEPKDGEDLGVDKDADFGQDDY